MLNLSPPTHRYCVIKEVSSHDTSVKNPRIYSVYNISVRVKISFVGWPVPEHTSSLSPSLS